MKKKIFSKILTIILIILIMASISIAGYKAYDYFKNKKIDKEAHILVDDFDSKIPTITLAEYEKKQKEEENKKDDKKEEQQQTGGSNWKPKQSLFTPEVVGTIRIPRTGIKYPIYSIPGEKALESGIAILMTENGLNQPGKTILQGHNWNNWMFFSRNHLLKETNLVYIKDKRGVEIKYEIYKKFTTTSTDVSYLERDTKGKRELILSTCTNPAVNRLVLLAREL